MKKSLKKMMAGVSAVAMLAAAMPIAGAFAEEVTEPNTDATVATDATDATDATEATDATDAPAGDVVIENDTPFSIREVENGLIITNYAETEETDKIVIPAEIGGMTVVGIDNFAFGMVEEEVTFVVPETLMLENIANEAFMTAAVVGTEAIAAAGLENGSIKDIVTYWVNDQFGMGYTDEQIVEAIQRAIIHISDVEVANMTNAEAAVAVIKEIQAGNCGFSQANVDRLNIALATLPYTLVTLEGPDATAAQEYAAGKFNLTYVVASGYEPGDMNLDGKVDLYDAIAIAKYMIKTLEATDEQLVAGDITGDGKVDLYDAIAVSKTLMG